MPKKEKMREQMPQTAAFIDALRLAFDSDMINAQIRKGINGQATFCASENGYAVGVPILKSAARNVDGNVMADKLTGATND
ncbi:hypothetical protein [Collimonas fungivorans]|uniref:hypothetical protein n=1 Tax=Collimonas fungivorans TaxID=158899 RepID=UPI0005A00F8E|nr:hypothetical protein [Collimonas fungivorans]